MSKPQPTSRVDAPEAKALGFAPEIDVPVPYMQRTRDYYLALGYGNPYRWGQFSEVPFTALGKPLDRCRVALVTTAARFDPALGEQGPGAPYNAGAKFYSPYAESTEALPDLRISHVGYDRKHTRADDQASYFPLRALREAEARGRVGSVSPRFYGAPTNRSQRVTLESDAPRILDLLREDDVDVALLVAN